MNLAGLPLLCTVPGVHLDEHQVPAAVLSAAAGQVDGERYVGFVNKVSDPAARLLTSRYSHEQLAYFGALVRTVSCDTGSCCKRACCSASIASAAE